MTPISGHGSASTAKTTAMPWRSTTANRQKAHKGNPIGGTLQKSAAKTTANRLPPKGRVNAAPRRLDRRERTLHPTCPFSNLAEPDYRQALRGNLNLSGAASLKCRRVRSDSALMTVDHVHLVTRSIHPAAANSVTSARYSASLRHAGCSASSPVMLLSD